MKQKSIILGTLIFIVGGIVGGLVFTRHYGVGPLANLGSRSSSANGPADAFGPCMTQRDNFVQYIENYRGTKGYSVSVLGQLESNYLDCMNTVNNALNQ